MQATLVHTAETIRVKYFIDLLVENKRPVMLVGNAGTGKTVLMQDKLNNLGDDYLAQNVPFNFYTTSEMLQVDIYLAFLEIICVMCREMVTHVA